MRPESRKNELLTQSVGDELVIYDERSHEAHHLSPTAAVVWRAADGERSVPELSSILRESLNATPSATPAVSDEDGEELVRLALDELDRVGLLVRGLPGIRESMSRREMLGVTAALLPVIASIVAPTPAMAQTPTVPVNPFAEFNGLYNGTGAVTGELNPCTFGSTPITTILNLLPAPLDLVSTLTIRHVNANFTFSFGGAASPIIVVESLANSLIIEATGSAQVGANFFNIFNTLSFGRSAGVVNMNGLQSFSGQCGNFPFSINGRK